jgi:hypothetical protein
MIQHLFNATGQMPENTLQWFACIGTIVFCVLIGFALLGLLVPRKRI